MARTATNTATNTYTRLRISVVQSQFEIFLRYAGLSGKRMTKFCDAISDRKIEILRLAILDSDEVVASISLHVDWVLHDQMVSLEGDMFNTYRNGWIDGVAPEIDVYAAQISKMADELNKKLDFFVVFSEAVRSDSSEHDRMRAQLDLAPCKKQYAFSSDDFGGHRKREVPGLPELALDMWVG